MKILFRFFIGFVFLIGFKNHSWAQQNYVLYNMQYLNQNISCNPSFFPTSDYNINIPFLSSTYFGFTNTTFAYQDIVQKRSDDSLIIDMNKAINRMKDKNYLLGNFETDLLAFGFRINKNFIQFSATEKITSVASYSKDLVDFLWNGNGPSIGQTINFAAGFQYTHYREYGINYVRQINSQWTGGVKLKYLYGMENIQTKKADVKLYTDPTDYNLRVQSDILFNKSGNYKEVFGADKNWKEYFLGLKNTGFAVDLGAQYKVTPKITVSATLLDFGGINWNHKPYNLVTRNPQDIYTFRGLYIADLINDTTSLNQAFNKTLDSAYASFRIDTTYHSYRSKLNRQIYLGGTYQIAEKYNTGLLLHGLFFDGKMRPGLSAFIGGQLTELIHLNMNYSIFNNSFSNLGLGLCINSWGGTQYYIISDNILGAVFPQSVKTFNLRIGVNLRFGNDSYLDDSDGDGVPDFEDKCRNHKGLPATHGCPDRDNDGVPDFEDQCPDEYGKALLGGCPDRDGDKIIDKFDKCPDTPGISRFQGCPDRDEDGVKDDDDDCPDVKGLPEFRGCPDTDGDGIPDKDDLCPNEFGPRDNNGCPIDTDKDGVPDIDDHCPTEPGLKENFGCPDKDTDLDGVLDREDLCPLTKGSVANKGCPEPLPEEALIVKEAVEHIKFETGKDELLGVSFVHLDHLVQMMKNNLSIILVINVFTDNSGSNSFAMTLTKDRATNLIEFFIGKGINNDRLKITPYGDTVSIADNNTAEGRDANNRVEITIQFK